MVNDLKMAVWVAALSGCCVSFLCAQPIEARLVKDIQPGPASSAPRNFRMYKEHLYFVANDANFLADVWVTDGSESGTSMVLNLPDAAYYVDNSLIVGPAGHLCLFTKKADPDYTYTLWSIHVASGTAQMIDSVNIQNTAWRDMTLFDNDLWFRAGTRLLRFDAATGQVQSILASQDVKDQLLATEEALYWVNYHVVAGTDNMEVQLMHIPAGSTAPAQVATLWSGKASDSPVVTLKAHGNQPYGWMNFGGGPQPVRGDWAFAPAYPVLTLSAPAHISQANTSDHHLFVFSDERPDMFTSENAHLWVAQKGNTLFQDILPVGLNHIAPIVTTGRRAYFPAFSSRGAVDEGLWTSDGTPAGTLLLVPPIAGSSFLTGPADAFSCGERLVFSQRAGNDYIFWTTEGTPATTAPWARTGPTNSGMEFRIFYKDTLFFTSYSVLHGSELWKLPSPCARTTQSGIGAAAPPDCHLSPNPAGYFTNLHTGNTGRVPVQVRIFSNTGTLMWESVGDPNSEDARIPVEGWPEGIYFVQMQQQGRLAVQKLAVMRP